MSDFLTAAAHDVLSERRRQIESEGWTSEHDDQHHTGAMAKAAACYANPRKHRDPRIVTPLDWPQEWGAKWWKPKDRRHDLVRAAALILAEIERLDRATDDAALLEAINDPDAEEGSL
jgi:hypothetical protein